MRNARNFIAGCHQPSLLAVLSGDPLELLGEFWHDANREWFGGKLKPVPIVVGLSPRKAKKSTVMATFGPAYPQPGMQIAFRRSLLDRLDEPGLYLETTDVLLHEMIHQAVFTARMDHEPSHGPEFTAWCNRIGATLGLAEVTARKPRNRPGKLSRYWPGTVRPAGAYALLKPRRVHWNRHDGNPLPRRAALVTRPGRLGNPFVMTVEPLQTREDVIRLHREWLNGDGPDEHSFTNDFGFKWGYSRSKALALLADLGGYDIACACPEGVPCHGDTLLELANAAAGGQ